MTITNPCPQPWKAIIPHALVVLALGAALAMLCGGCVSEKAMKAMLANGGTVSIKSTTFGVAVAENFATSLYELKLGLVRNEITINSANAQHLSATTIQSMGFLRNRVQTVIADGTSGVVAGGSTNLMPFESSSLLSDLEMRLNKVEAKPTP